MNRQHIDEDTLRKILEMHAAQQQQQQSDNQAYARRAQAAQNALNNTPPQRRPIMLIAAVDQNRGFAKKGEIPWHYAADFQWFKNRTDGMICIMGRNTYEDINRRLGEKAAESVLPGRTCFVVSSTLKELPNATVVKSLAEIEQHLANDDDRPAFVIGGGRLFTEAIALAAAVYLTIINKDYECDQYFPVEYLQEHFTAGQMFKTEGADDLRFTVWKRK